jgi:hypothetical protein
MTDGAGNYALAGLYSGSYMVTVVTPLGFSTNPEEVEVTLLPAESASLDYALSCLVTSANPRSIGFWKHQVGVATGGRGQAEMDASALCDYLDAIQAHFNDNQINQVQVYEPPASGECGGEAGKLAVAKELLNLKGSAAMIDRAKQQLMALLLNVAAGKLGLTTIITEDGATVSQAITYCDLAIDDPLGNWERAKDIADAINNGLQVPATWIPLETRFIAYSRRSQVETPAGLLRVSPNPAGGHRTFTFATTIPGHVRLDVFDVAGRRIATIFNGHLEPGLRTIPWDGRADSGARIANGLYVVRLSTPTGRQAMRMLQVGP